MDVIRLAGKESNLELIHFEVTECEKDWIRSGITKFFFNYKYSV